MKLIRHAFALAALILPGHVAADAATELAKKTQNPVSDLISVPFENNANFNAGPDDKVLNVLNIKPVVPLKLNDEWNLINRAIIPLISQPGVDGTPVDRKNGVGDITYQGFFFAESETRRHDLGCRATDPDTDTQQQPSGQSTLGGWSECCCAGYGRKDGQGLPAVPGMGCHQLKG